MAALGARAARSFALASLLLAILGHSGQAQEWQCGQTAAVNPPSPEEMKTSLIVNQIAIIRLIRDISNTLEGMAEKVARRDEEAAARDERLQETLKGMAENEARRQEAAAARDEKIEEILKRLQEDEQRCSQETVKPITTSTQATVTTCPDGWMRREESCYLVVHDTSRTWDNSLEYCRGLGGDLAKITSAEEDQFITAHLSSTRDVYWIGLNDRETEGRFVWTDGTAPTYTRWSEGQPDNYGGGKDCVTMYRPHDGKWYDNPCSVSYGAVCERPVHA